MLSAFVPSSAEWSQKDQHITYCSPDLDLRVCKDFYVNLRWLDSSQLPRHVPAKFNIQYGLLGVHRYWRGGDQLRTRGVLRTEQSPACDERLQRASRRWGIDCCQCLGGRGHTECDAVASIDHVRRGPPSMSIPRLIQVRVYQAPLTVHDHDMIVLPLFGVL